MYWYILIGTLVENRQTTITLKTCIMKNIKNKWMKIFKNWNVTLEELAKASSYAIHR
ncbi:MAG: hypothetical protein ACI828_002364 [Flavobacteriales bacterium]|jgi:hypothetical protein